LAHSDGGGIGPSIAVRRPLCASVDSGAPSFVQPAAQSASHAPHDASIIRVQDSDEYEGG